MADDRYKMTNRKNRMRRRIEQWRSEDEREAAAENARGQFRCAECDKYLPLCEFEYVFEGETKVARRCEDCRSEWRRKMRGTGGLNR